MRRILITGGTGQLGIELLRQAWPASVQIHAPSRSELDLGDAHSIRAAIEGESWACVINSAAYTAVDAAESDAANAFLANCQAPACLAEMTAMAGVPLIHVSTDYVFSGDKAEPYRENDPISPVGVYGASKAAGELAVRTINPRSVILRTAWVLSAHRSNFLKTMLRLGANRPTLRVVADQRGCPTSAADIAGAIATIALRLINDESAPSGTYHFVNSGEASWHELAVEIFRLSAMHGGPTADVEPIATSEYPTAASRPANSRLATDKIDRDYGIKSRDWQPAVAEIIAELDQAGELKELVR
jgi:dTDP-4-dehydrorhamnose reductase